MVEETVLKVVVTDAHFAKKANYFVALQCLQQNTKGRTEVCEADENPTFKKNAFEFTFTGALGDVLSDTTDEQLQVGGFVVLGPSSTSHGADQPSAEVGRDLLPAVLQK